MKRAVGFSILLSLALGLIVVFRGGTLLGSILICVALFSAFGWFLFTPRETVSHRGISITHPILKMRSRFIPWSEIAEVKDLPVHGRSGFILCREGVLTLTDGSEVRIDERTLKRIRVRPRKEIRTGL